MTADRASGRLGRWEVIESAWAFRSGFLGIRRDRCRLPDGRLSPDFYFMELRDVCLTVALTPDRRVLLAREYKHGAGDVIATLPAGFVEPGEAPEVAARRELLEETGYAARSFEPLASLLLFAGLSGSRAHFFLARDAAAVSAPHPDEYEEIEVMAVPLAEALPVVKDAPSALGLALAVSRLGEPVRASAAASAEEASR